MYLQPSPLMLPIPKTEDRTFRIFGDGILSDEFLVTVYNGFGAEVYKEDNFEIATTTGWDGGDEPVGSYTYFVKFLNELGNITSKTGVVLLIR